MRQKKKIVVDGTTIYDSEDSSTYDGGALIQNSLSVHRKENQATQCKFSLSRGISKLIGKKSNVKIFSSFGNGNYSTTPYFFGDVGEIESTSDAIDITCYGPIAYMSDTIIDNEYSGEINGMSAASALRALFVGDGSIPAPEFYTFLETNGYLYDVSGILTLSALPLSNQNTEDDGPIEWTAPVLRIDIIKKVLDKTFDYEVDYPYPLQYSLIERGNDLYLIREQYDIKVSDCVLSITSGTKPLVGNIEWTPVTSKRYANMICMVGKDWDGKVISETTAVPTNERPVVKLVTNNNIRSTAALKEAANKFLKYYRAEKYTIRFRLSDGLNLYPGMYVYIKDRKTGREGAFMIREVSIDSSGTSVLAGEKELELIDVIRNINN